MKNDLEPIAFSKISKIKKIKKIFRKFIKKMSLLRMTGSGSAIVAYFNSKKDVKKQKKLKNNIKITGVYHQKLYKFFFFVLYEFNIGA